MTSQNPTETDHLVSARAGNTEAFTALVVPYRKPLMVHCYRLSGSLDDAEDLVQETFLRAWKKLDSYQGRGSFRNWLYVIATRQWLDEVRKRKKQVLLPLDGQPTNPDAPPRPPSTPTSWLDPLPDSWVAGADPSAEFSYEQREMISIAFMVVLQKLNPRQRVVLILRTALNWSAKDVAGVLGVTVGSVNNLLYRARKNLEGPVYEEVPASKNGLKHFVSAWESGDVHSLIELLHEKATFAMPPMGVWYTGRDAIARALQNFVFAPNVSWILMPTSANGRAAFCIYQGGEGTQSYQAFGLILPLWGKEEGKMREITAFLAPHLVERFGMPPTITP